MSLSAPCKDCGDRVIGCHSTCDKYKQFADERKEYVRKVKACKRKEREYMEVKQTSIYKSLRNAGKKMT